MQQIFLNTNVGGRKMKIFHTENGKEVVYVQIQDIVELNQSDMTIPASIYLNAFNEIGFVYDSNRFNFVRLDEEQEVKFFRELDFVIDYDKYKDLSDEQLEEEWKKLANKSNEIAKKWNYMSDDEREKNSNIFQEHENLEYMMKFLTEIYAIKHNKKMMQFPDFVQISQTMPKKKSFFEKISFWRKR